MDLLYASYVCMCGSGGGGGGMEELYIVILHPLKMNFMGGRGILWGEGVFYGWEGVFYGEKGYFMGGRVFLELG